MKASVALPPLENTAASRGWFAPLLARFGPLSAAKRTGLFMTTSAQPARSRAVGRARARGCFPRSGGGSLLDLSTGLVFFFSTALFCARRGVRVCVAEER